ncbi:hypothetical protein ACPXCX_35555 [Streptomyces sp. DT225]
MDVRTPPHDAAPDAERPVRTAVGDLDALPPGPPSEPRTPRWPTGPLPAGRGGLFLRVQPVGGRDRRPDHPQRPAGGPGRPGHRRLRRPCSGVHGVDERVSPADLRVVYAVYRRAVLGLPQA